MGQGKTPSRAVAIDTAIPSRFSCSGSPHINYDPWPVPSLSGHTGATELIITMSAAAAGTSIKDWRSIVTLLAFVFASK